MKNIHGHEVMQMMLDSGRGYTKESLAQEIEQKFGADARFYTCSASDMNAQEIVLFLEQAGKFIPLENGFTTSEDRICNH